MTVLKDNETPTLKGSKANTKKEALVKEQRHAKLQELVLSNLTHILEVAELDGILSENCSSSTSSKSSILTRVSNLFTGKKGSGVFGQPLPRITSSSEIPKFLTNMMAYVEQSKLCSSVLHLDLFSEIRLC